jgi:hypothetical protein
MRPALWTWKQLRAAGAKIKVPKDKPAPVIEVLNRTNRSTYIIKRKRAA